MKDQWLYPVILMFVSRVPHNKRDTLITYAESDIDCSFSSDAHASFVCCSL